MCFSSDWCVTPLLLLEQLEPIFNDLMMKYTTLIWGRCVQLDAIGANACLMVVFSGFYESPGPPPPGDVRGIVLSHHHGH